MALRRPSLSASAPSSAASSLEDVSSSAVPALATCAAGVKIWQYSAASGLYERPYAPSSDLHDVQHAHFRACAWAGNGKALVVGREDGAVSFLHSDKPEDPVRSLDVQFKTTAGDLHCLAFSNAGHHVVCGSSKGYIELLDLKSRSWTKRYEDPRNKAGHSNVFYPCISFNMPDDHIAAGSSAGDILLFNSTTGSMAQRLRQASNQRINTLSFHFSDRNTLAAGDDVGTVQVWDVISGLPKSTFKNAGAPVTGISFTSVSDKLLGTAGLDKRVVFYDVNSRGPVKQFNVGEPLTAMHASGHFYAVGTQLGRVALYDLRGGSQPLSAITAYQSMPVDSLQFTVSRRDKRVKPRTGESISADPRRASTSGNAPSVPAAPSASSDRKLSLSSQQLQHLQEPIVPPLPPPPPAPSAPIVQIQSSLTPPRAAPTPVPSSSSFNAPASPSRYQSTPMSDGFSSAPVAASASIPAAPSMSSSEPDFSVRSRASFAPPPSSQQPSSIMSSYTSIRSSLGGANFPASSSNSFLSQYPTLDDLRKSSFGQPQPQPQPQFAQPSIPQQPQQQQQQQQQQPSSPYERTLAITRELQAQSQQHIQSLTPPPAAAAPSALSSQPSPYSSKSIPPSSPTLSSSSAQPMSISSPMHQSFSSASASVPTPSSATPPRLSTFARSMPPSPAAPLSQQQSLPVSVASSSASASSSTYLPPPVAVQSSADLFSQPSSLSSSSRPSFFATPSPDLYPIGSSVEFGPSSVASSFSANNIPSSMSGSFSQPAPAPTPAPAIVQNNPLPSSVPNLPFQLQSQTARAELFSFSNHNNMNNDKSVPAPVAAAAAAAVSQPFSQKPQQQPSIPSSYSSLSDGNISAITSMLSQVLQRLDAIEQKQSTLQEAIRQVDQKFDEFVDEDFAWKAPQGVYISELHRQMQAIHRENQVLSAEKATMNLELSRFRHPH